jgi:sulfur carrier protein ThiS
MTTETITISPDATVAMLLKKIVAKNKRYVISVDGSPVFEVNPVEEEMTPEMHKTYIEAKSDYEKGVNITTIDFDKVTTFADFEKMLNE